MLLLGAVLVAPAGCYAPCTPRGERCLDPSATATPTPVPTQWPAGRQFVAELIVEDGARRQLLRGTQLTIWFQEPGSLEAYAGCHGLAVSALVEGNRLVPQRLRIELKDCPAGSAAQDAWLRAFFENSPLWIRRGDTIMLWTDRIVIALTALPSP